MSRNTYAVQQLLIKMKNPDSDLRFMALTDLMSEIARNRESFGTDDQTEHSTVETVLSLMNDTNGEVKNLAVKALAALIKQVAEHRIQIIIDKLVSFTSSKDESVRDIASLGLRTVVAEIDSTEPSAAALRKTVCTRLAPKVVQQLESNASSSELLIDALDLMTDIVSRFESSIKTLPQLQSSILNATTALLSHSRPAVRKRAITVLGRLVPASDDAVFTNLIDSTLLPLMKSSDAQKQKTAIALAGALARSSPRQMGSKAAKVLPSVLSAATCGDGDDTDEELVEQSLQTLEAFVLRCPTETGPSLNDIITKAIDAIKYDPNYAGGDGDDEDEDMVDEDDQDQDVDEDEFADEYSDEDDTSWKIRRAAAKVLTACIATRQDLLAAFMKTIGPALIARFSEREETVKVDIWATYKLLVDQLQSSAQPVPESRAHTPNGTARQLKRKRDSTAQSMDVEESPMSLLLSQAPAVVKSIVKQLNPKSLQTRSAGFALLNSLVRVLHGGLESQVALLLTRIESSLRVSDSGASGAATSLRIEILSFMSLFIRNHPVRAFADQVPAIVALLVVCIEDRLNRVSAEALSCCTDLVRVLRAPGSTSSSVGANEIKKIYAATAKRLASPESDEDVRSKALVCIGQLLSSAFDLLGKDAEDGLRVLSDRLKNEVTRLTAVSVTTFVAESPLVTGKQADKWTTESLVEISPALRKVHRPLKIASFAAIRNLVKRGAQTIPSHVLETVLEDLSTLLNESADIVVLSSAVSTVSIITETCPASASFVESNVTPKVVQLAVLPTLQGPALEGALGFFATIVNAGADPKALVGSIASAAQSVDLAGASNGAAAIGAIVRGRSDIAQKLQKDYVKVIKDSNASPESLFFALHVIGEIGRIQVLDSKSFNAVVDLFTSSSDDVRRAAAFAAGNAAVGNPDQLLKPVIELTKADDKKRMLALHSLKELITHCSPAVLGPVSDQLWGPLFDNCEAQDEATRNIAADCLGQITVIDPQKYLPQLQSRLTAPSRDTRATVISAIRYTFTNESSLYDELLTPVIVDFFKLMHDSDLGVRRLALSALNSAAHNKPHLLRDDLATLLSELYKQTEIDESLIRMVEMGPFKHKVDDGLDIRKTAYECMHTLLESCFKYMDLHNYLNHVIGGLSDDEEVQKLCYLMMVKLATIAPTATAQKLDDTVEPMQTTMNTTLKDNAVKQETERLLELQKSCLRCISALAKISSAGSTPKFESFVQSVKNGKWSSEFAELSNSTAQQMAHIDMMETD